MADKETLDAVKAEMGTHAAKIIERIEKSEERAKKMDERMAAIEGAGGAAGREYLAALQRGTPMTARADENLDDFVDRMVSESDERAMVGALGRGRAVRSQGRRIAHRASLDIVRVLRAIAVAKIRDGIETTSTMPGHDSVLRVLGDWGDKRTAGLVEEARDLHKRSLEAPPEKRARRAMNSSLLGAGAGFVTTQMYAGLVDFLWPKTVVRALGATSIPVTKNSIEVLYIDSAASAARRGQLNAATQTSVTEKRLLLTLKLLSAFMAASNELLDEADISLDVFYRAMLTRAIATKENLDFLTSLGSQNEPRGADWWVDSSKNAMVSSAHKFDRTLSGGLPTFKTCRADLLKLQQVVAEEDIDLSLGTPGYAMSMATQFGLLRALNAYDTPIFGNEMRGGTLLGVPFAATTQIAKTEAGDGAGSGTGNKGKVYFGDWSTCVIAEDPNVELKVVDGGTYKDVNGNVVTGLTTNETVFVVHAKNDFGCLYRGKELARLDSVDWASAF